MKCISQCSRLFLAGILIALFTACSSSSSSSGNNQPNPNPEPEPTPYPDPSNPSAFPTQSDTLEGTSGDNTSGNATTAAVGDVSYHTIYPNEDVDWIKINLSAGVEYEFTVDNVSYNGFPRLEFFTASDLNVPVDQSVGYFASNPRISYTPVSGGDYYLKVSSSIRDANFITKGVFSYTLSTRAFSDSDGDTYSPYYDCDDTDIDIFPWQVDTAGDTVDQSCSGYDWPDPNSADSFEPDGDFATASSIPILGGDAFDIIHRGDVYSQTHTLENGDTDIFKITVPAHTFYEIYDIETNGVDFDYHLYLAPDTATPIVSQVNSGFIYEFLDNSDSATAAEYYLEIATNNIAETATYVLGIGNIGTDADGDSHWTQAQGLGWDCDDTDETIHSTAAETAGDSIDSNCNGKDDS